MHVLTVVALGLAAIAPPEPQHLSGPTVSAPERAPDSLVERAMDGSVRRAEPTPEQAALRLLDLDPSSRARVDDIFIQRGRLLDEFVAGNLNLLVKLGTASASGDKADQLALLTEAAWKLRPVLEAGTLQAQVEAALPPEPRARFVALLDEYRDALVHERRRADPKAPRAGVLFGEALQSLGREIERAFARQNNAGEILYRYATEGLGLDTHQERVVREAVARFAERGGEDAPEEAKRDLFISVMFVLTEAQRAKLIERFKGG